MPQDPVTENRICNLLEQMTLEEKVGQLNQVPNNKNLDFDQIRKGRIGSIICATNPTAGNVAQERVFASFQNEMQKVAVEESRLGIPLLFGRDVIHGHRTVAPIPIGQACSWDPEMVETVANDAAREARADGINWTFTPMLDVARDPRWGRIAEGYGEDPYLASRLSEAAVRGFQGEDMSSDDRVMACAKHYLGYGAAEGGRDYNTTELTPSTLRNIYAPPFKAAVDAGVGSVMSAFQEIGGAPMTSNRHWLREVLKQEWRFDGMVVSDWAAVDELVQHGVAEDRRQAARLALEAGVDMDMVEQVYLQNLADLVENGELPMALIDDAVKRVLRAKIRLGLFDNPYVDESLAERVHRRQDHLERARSLAQKSAVLLRNQNDILPFGNKWKTIGVFGPLADATGLLMGTWTLDGRAEDTTSILEGIRKHQEPVVHAEAVDDIISQSRWCDLIVAVVGESPGRSGEDHSTMSLDLPPGQLEMLQALRALRKPLVVIVIAGRPLAISWILENADAVLWSFHPGTEGGLAIADLLFGEASPSGKIPVTFPRNVGQVPIYYNHKPTGRPDPAAGRYVDGPDSPLLPFGFGLSYTRFEYSDLTVKGLEFGATVKNVGRTAGDEIVQLYVRDFSASITRPVKELKGFQKVTLLPSEETRVVFQLSREELGFYNNQEEFCIEPGRYRVWIGPNSRDGLESTFELVA